MNLQLEVSKIIGGTPEGVEINNLFKNGASQVEIKERINKLFVNDKDTRQELLSLFKGDSRDYTVSEVRKMKSDMSEDEFLEFAKHDERSTVEDLL